MRATAEAPSNVAFIKYWGRKDEELRLPTNGSISMNLDGLKTTTTVLFDRSLEQDVVTINDEIEVGDGYQKIAKHLDRVRSLAGISEKAKVVSKNTFPRSTGLSSSASGFAALTLAAVAAAGLKLSEKELSILARQGSGSACRSIPDGFVQWLDGETSEDSYAVSIFPPDYWKLVDVVCILSTDAKKIPTSEGQKFSDTSPYFAERVKSIPVKIAQMKEYIAARDFRKFGELIEEEALDLHRIMETSVPPLFYMTDQTKQMIEYVRSWRRKGLPVYFTINTGENIHILCEEKHKEELVKKVDSTEIIKQSIINYPVKGARLLAESVI